MALEPAEHKKKIMIVEDEFLVASDIAESLENMGYGIARIASSAEEMLAMLQQEKPDLIFLDNAWALDSYDICEERQTRLPKDSAGLSQAVCTRKVVY